MKRDVKLENIEMDALKVISEAHCSGIPCALCPLQYHKGNTSFCVKGLCQDLLEKYNQE